MTQSRVSVLGVLVNPLNMQSTLAKMQNWVQERKSTYVCVAPAHSIMECVNDPSLLPVFNEANMVTPDGMSIVWFLRLSGYKDVQRVYGPDLLLAACEYGLTKGWRHYFYGGAPGVAQKLAENLQQRYTGMNITGTFSPPFSRPTKEEELVILETINSAETDILWVGMSSPWQEIWMHEHIGQLNIPVMVGVGAAFDYLSGCKVQAPRWMQRCGLEWLFRFLSEPKRLWPRYKQYPRFVFLALLQLLGLRKFEK